MNKINAFQKAVNTDKVVTNKDVLDHEYATNSNKIVASIADALGMENIFKRRVTETEKGEILRDYVTSEGSEAIISELNTLAK